jgi:bacillithiol biosynthesis cysteine-adding enzyme BshC
VPAKAMDGSSQTGEPEPSGRIPVDLRSYPGIRRLIVDYSCHFSSLADFFPGDPHDRRAWTSAIERTLTYRRSRSEIASIVEAQLQRREAPAEAIHAAGKLRDGSTLAVVTGQQAGLFGGPLFTLFKAITALKLARQLSADYGVTAIAVFWVDAEDHDWDEVRSCTVFDESLVPRSVALPADAAQTASPVAAVTLGSSIAGVLDDLESVLPASEFRSQLLQDLRTIYSPEAQMADAFSRWLERVLGHRGLVVYDSSDIAAKRLASEIFARELSMPGETTRLATSAGSELAARGYHWQVRMAEDSLALFQLDGSRQLIRHRDGALVVGDRRYAPPELVEEARQRPARFSPNVLLRPVVQDALFPTVSYVAGPNELGYLAQLARVYEHFAVPMPLVYPRAMGTILDASAVRFLTKHRLPLDAVQPQDEATLNDLLEKQIPAAVEQAFKATEAAIDAEMSRLTSALPSLDPTLEGAARSTAKRMQHELETLHGKMIAAAKRRDETLRRQYVRVRALAFPNGHPQEREIGFVSFLNQYGPALIDRLDEELPLQMGQHWIVTI